jgi:hypothetical protein
LELIFWYGLRRLGIHATCCAMVNEKLYTRI